MDMTINLSTEKDLASVTFKQDGAETTVKMTKPELVKYISAED